VLERLRASPDAKAYVMKYSTSFKGVVSKLKGKGKQLKITQFFKKKKIVK
jgi:hypothetical protein